MDFNSQFKKYYDLAEEIVEKNKLYTKEEAINNALIDLNAKQDEVMKVIEEECKNKNSKWGN